MRDFGLSRTDILVTTLADCTHLALKFLAISTLEKFEIDLRILRGFKIDAAHHRWRHLSSANGTSKE